MDERIDIVILKVIDTECIYVAYILPWTAMSDT